MSLLPRSEGYNYTGPCPAYSPDGRYIATAEEFRLVVRDVDTLQITQLYSCLDRIKHIRWCCRSEYILCGLLKRAVVQASAPTALGNACHTHILQCSWCASSSMGLYCDRC